MRSTVRTGVATRITAAAAGLLAFAAPFSGARAQGEIDPDATRILQAMSRFMTDLKTFTAEFHVETEIIDTAGQKLAFNGTGEVAVQRPNRLYSRRKGAATEGELFFDGKTVSIFSKAFNGYAQLPGPETIGQAIETVRSRTDIDLPAADLLYPDPASGLLTDVQSGTYLGRDDIDGVACDHLAFRAKKVDWQIWVQRGDAPVPVKYVITTKWFTGAPQHSIHLFGWNLRAKLEPKRFEFVPPPGATRHEPEAVRVNEVGEVSEMERK